MERRITSRTAYAGSVVTVRVDEVELPSGRRARREVVEHRGSVVMVPVTEGGDVLLVRQHRYAVGETLLEIPAGTLEPGEDPLEAAQRELAEEVGRRAARWEKLAQFYASPGYLTEEKHLYLATGLSEAAAEREEEDLAVEAVPLAQAGRLIADRVVRDAKSIVGLLLAAARLGRLPL